MRRQELGQQAAGVGLAAAGQLGGRAFGDDLAAVGAAFGTDVDDPVGLGPDVLVVFDDQQGVAGIDEAVHDVQQFLHVGHVQADGGLVQDVEGAAVDDLALVAGLARAGAGGGLGLGFAQRVDLFGEGANLGQFGDELDALGLAAGQGGALLPQGEVAQAHVLQQLQRVGDGAPRGEELQGFVHSHVQHVGDGLAVEADLVGLGVETSAAAGVAEDAHVGQEVHLDGAHALAFAGGAAAAGGVEGEARGGVAAQAGFAGVGEEAADGVPEADVGGGGGARGLADGGLVHFQHALDALPALQVLAVGELAALAGQLALQGVQQHVAGEGGFSGA